MFKLTTALALTLSFASAQFLNLRDLQAAAVNTTSPTGGTWMNGTCSRSAATDSCTTGTCCAQVFMNGTMSTLINATTGLCFPVGFANSLFQVGSANWTVGSCLLPASVTAYAASWNTNVSSCTAGQCAASITYNFAGSNGNQTAVTACRNSSATPVNVQWWSYPGPSG